jgi:hypothetical protein
MTNYYNNILKKIENCESDNYMKIMTQISTTPLEFVNKIFSAKFAKKIYLGILSLKHVLPEI